MLYVMKLQYFGEHLLLISFISQFKKHLLCTNCTSELQEAPGGEFHRVDEEGWVLHLNKQNPKNKQLNQNHCCKNNDSYCLYSLRLIQNRSSQYI